MDQSELTSPAKQGPITGVVSCSECGCIKFEATPDGATSYILKCSHCGAVFEVELKPNRFGTVTISANLEELPEDE